MSEPARHHPREEDLHAYLDGELSEHQVVEIEYHLESCLSCTETVAYLRALFIQIDSLSEAQLEVDLVPGVLQTIRVKPSQDPRWERVLAVQLVFFSTVVILLSGSLLTQIEGVLALIRNWLGQASFQSELGLLFQWIRLAIAKFQPEVPGVLELSIPRPFSVSPEIGWTLIGLAACLAWLLANRWLLTQSLTEEINPNQRA